MKFKIRAHPLIILDKFKPFLFVLILPFIKGFLQYIYYGKVSGILSLEIAAFILVLFIALFYWKSFLFEIEKDRVIIYSGVFIKHISYIEICKISNITFKQNIVEKIFGAVTVKICTEAGKKGKEEFKFKVSVYDAKKIKESIYGRKKNKKIKFNLFRIAVWAAAESSALSGMLIGAPVINYGGNLLGVAIYNLLLDKINHISSEFNIFIPPAIKILTIVIIITYAVGFIYFLIKNIGFSLKIGRDTVAVTRGLISKKETVFSYKAVNNLCIEQTFLMRLFRQSLMSVSVGEWGDKHSKKTIIAPCVNKRKIKKDFLPVFRCLNIKNNYTIVPKRTKEEFRRFIRIPVCIGVINVGIAALIVLTFPFFDVFVIYMTFFTLSIIGYWCYLNIFNYKKGKLSLGENIFAKGSKGLKMRELYCEKSRVGSFKIREFPSDRKFGTCKVRVAICSLKADFIWIRNIEKKSLIENIKITYNLNKL